MSFSGPTTEASERAFLPSVAWNAKRDRVLVGWLADMDLAGIPEAEIWAREVSPSLSLFLTTQVRVSEMGVDGDSGARAWTPAVAWTNRDDQYLVVWSGYHETVVSARVGLDKGGGGAQDQEIWGRSLRYQGVVPQLGPQMAISAMGYAEPDPSDYDAWTPAIIAAPGGFAVSWTADSPTDGQVDNEREIFARSVLGHWIFVDGWESGTHSAWSSHVP